jgi:arabinoxylan arabinofuranohydrolase
MNRIKFVLKRQQLILLIAAMFLFSVKESTSQSVHESPNIKQTFRVAGNPYLPLWEHLPDGNPVFLKIRTIPGNIATTLSDRTM